MWVSTDLLKILDMQQDAIQAWDLCGGVLGPKVLQVNVDVLALPKVEYLF